jgi:hypothetical protein
MSILRAGAFASFAPGTAFDLAEVLQSLIAAGELAAFGVTQRFYEIGSEAGFQETDAHLRAMDKLEEWHDV